MADPNSLIQLPWKPEVAWVAGDLVMNGKPVEQAPRRVLQRQIQRAAERGYAVRTGRRVRVLRAVAGRRGRSATAATSRASPATTSRR